ncbi:serine-rich adhesin for platelets [Stomoxys calcitrans]|uniref:serine-rich adhesin for platelets n=1 Tax=Stomoxys calcitrans TaxID=35570 RepID=UPI0027E2A29E|nr:serine-rich adhesin for platelets [Stomoxys calcitrans]
MLRTPTHFVEIGTNTTKSSTPLIQKLQHQHQHQLHSAPGTKYHYHEQYSKIVDNQQVCHSTKKQQLQTSKNINKLKKKNKSSSSSSSSNATSTSISSVSSVDSASTNTTISNCSNTTTTSSPPPSLTFKEHLLSRGLLSGSPFSFMRLKKAKNAAAVTTKTTELRKTSKRFVDFVDCSSNNNSNSSGTNDDSSYRKLSKTGAKIAASVTSATTEVKPSIATTETKSTPTATRTTGYFANILSSSGSSSSNSNTSSKNNSSSSHSSNTKNIHNNNNSNILNNNTNNNYLNSYTTTKALSASSKTNKSPSSTKSSADPQSVVATQYHTSTILPFVSFTNTVVAPPTLVATAVASPPIANAATATTTTTTTATMSPTTQAPPAARTSLFDSCHRKIRLIGGGPVAFLGGLVAKARRKERDGDQNSTDTKLYLEESVLERKLPEADLKALVDLPAGLDYNEWLASHTLALFEHVNLVYGTISEFCTTSGCPDMTGPGNRTYLWFDEKGKKTRVAAPQYIDYVMTFTQKTVSDESIFPTKYANEFPSSFESIARKILRLQFHVIAHLYAAHFREIALLGLHTHLNLTFAHLTALHRRFNLIDEKETDVLRDLEVALRLTDDITSSAGGGGGSESGDTTMSSTAGDSAKQGGEDVNSVQHNNTTTTLSLIDGGGPICTQPEAGTKPPQFGVGGGGGLIGGILGDLSSGEFGDTMHYCTSAVPAPSTNCSATSLLQNTTPSTCNTMNGTCSVAADQQHTPAALGGGGGGSGGGGGNNGNNGAGAFHQHNNNNHVTQPHHHHPHHHHAVHHHHHHPNHFAPNTGLIQCNASNAPTATAATTSTTTA